jgi:hypothetical protein
VVVPDFLADGPLLEHLVLNVGAEARALLFTSATGGPIRYSGFRRQHWLPAVERSGVGQLVMPELRHTYASIAASCGASVKMVQTQLGHADPALSLRLYQHLFDDDLDGLGTRISEAHNKATKHHSFRAARPERGLPNQFAIDDNRDKPLYWTFIGAPGKIRTCAHGLGNRCSIP